MVRVDSYRTVYAAVLNTDEIVGYAIGEQSPNAIKHNESELMAVHSLRNSQHQGSGSQLDQFNNRSISRSIGSISSSALAMTASAFSVA
jgi:hypothetical protein